MLEVVAWTLDSMRHAVGSSLSTIKLLTPLWWIENVSFHNNHAWYGGGNTIFSDLGNQLSHKKLNKLTFRNSTWKNNFADFSIAVDVSPNIYDNVIGGFPLATMFQNCSFIGNKVMSKENNKHFYFHSGTVMITALPVKFSGETIFADNVGTALHVVAARVTFDNHTHVTFENNNGDKGGALALVGMATLIFNSDSTFQFVNNHADFVGGAIYWYSVCEQPCRLCGWSHLLVLC